MKIDETEIIKTLRMCSSRDVQCNTCRYNRILGCKDVLMADAATAMENRINNVTTEGKQ